VVLLGVDAVAGEDGGGQGGLRAAGGVVGLDEAAASLSSAAHTPPQKRPDGRAQKCP
jgi:hypothetical protein